VLSGVSLGSALDTSLDDAIAAMELVSRGMSRRDQNTALHGSSGGDGGGSSAAFEGDALIEALQLVNRYHTDAKNAAESLGYMEAMGRQSSSSGGTARLGGKFGSYDIGYGDMGDVGGVHSGRNRLAVGDVGDDVRVRGAAGQDAARKGASPLPATSFTDVTVPSSTTPIPPSAAAAPSAEALTSVDASPWIFATLPKPGPVPYRQTDL